MVLNSSCVLGFLDICFNSGELSTVCFLLDLLDFLPFLDLFFVGKVEKVMFITLYKVIFVTISNDAIICRKKLCLIKLIQQVCLSSQV